jgi:hypothetical protein
MDHRRRTGKRPYGEAAFLTGWVSHDQAWPLFDGWCAAQNVDPFTLPWSRFLNLVYHFAVRNAPKDKKKEFDNAMTRVTSADSLRAMAAARVNALSSTQSAEKPAVVPEGAPETKPTRRTGLPPRPAGWGDAEDNTRQSLMAAQSLKVGGKTQL